MGIISKAFSLVKILIEVFEGDEPQAASDLFKQFGKKLFNSSSLGQIQNSYKSGKLKVDKLYANLNKLSGKERKQLLEAINNKTGKGGEKSQAQVAINFDGKINLSSSFLQYGIFEVNKRDKNIGQLTLAMSGKEYDFGIVKTRIWLSMTQALGQNGTGAGSVLWNTLWTSKRTKSLKTGGVAGSIENLIKNKRRISASVARNQKYINQLKPSIPKIARRARVARKQLKSRVFKF